jgi:hypothetical protein
LVVLEAQLALITDRAQSGTWFHVPFDCLGNIAANVGVGLEFGIEYIRWSNMVRRFDILADKFIFLQVGHVHKPSGAASFTINVYLSHEAQKDIQLA